MLSNLSGRFSEISKIGYRFLSSQPNRRPVWMLKQAIRVFHNPVSSPGPPVHATPLYIAEPSREGVEAEISSSDSDSDYLEESGSSSEGPNGDECIPDTPS
ncbi:hypothetical protein PIB30_056831, partial [Stylosanthes scabra]|nr:hypothetical protein [Stylosanthes scabra]